MANLLIPVAIPVARFSKSTGNNDQQGTSKADKTQKNTIHRL